MGVAFSDVAAKLEAGERLSEQETGTLEAERDIIALGMLADSARRKLHGNRVTFLRVADYPGTADRGSSGAGEIRIDAVPASLDAATSLVTSVCEEAGGVPVSGFSLADLEHLTDPLPVSLKALKDAGLELIAFAPVDKLQHVERSLETAIDAGLVVSRLTVETVPGRPWSEVCRQVAALQRKLQSFRVFAPLPRTLNVSQPTTGYEDVKRIALSRLLAGEIDSIQVDWELYGPKLAQVALTFGADDLDSVSATDDDSRGHRRAPLEEVQRSIKAAGFEPAARDGRFTLI